MRRALALLLAMFVAAASAEGGALACTGSSGFVSGSHGCCGGQTLSPGNTCCAISRQERQPGPIEPRITTEQLQISSLALPVLHLAADSTRTPDFLPFASLSPPVLVHLRQVALLI